VSTLSGVVSTKKITEKEPDVLRSVPFCSPRLPQPNVSDRISFKWVEMCDSCKKNNCTYTHILQVLSIKGALFFLQRRPKEPAPSFGHIAVHYSSGPVGFVDVPQYVET
jgi:hypothetical protein